MKNQPAQYGPLTVNSSISMHYKILFSGFNKIQRKEKEIRSYLTMLSFHNHYRVL